MTPPELLHPLPAAAPARPFDTTHWSVVLLAGQAQTPQSAEALEKLCRTYWSPLCAFIRRRGYGLEDAQDLTQKFFASLLERNDLETVDPIKGKFRTFLLAALTHFLANEREHAHAAKRGGGHSPLSLDALPAEPRATEPSITASPDKLFDLRWASTVLEQALHTLESEMAAGGKPRQFERLKAFLTEDPRDGDYAAAALDLGLTNQNVAVVVHRLRQRYRELVRAEVAQTVANPLDVEDEMRHLYQALTTAG